MVLNMLSRKKAFIAIVVVAIVAVAGFFLWQTFSGSYGEVENTIRSFIAALNNYDADASWALMSPTLQAFYGTKESFNGSIISGFRQFSWHAELTGISSKSIETKNSMTIARFVVTLQISQAGFSTYSDAYTFKLVKIEGQWKISDWQQGVWD